MMRQHRFRGKAVRRILWVSVGMICFLAAFFDVQAISFFKAGEERKTEMLFFDDTPIDIVFEAKRVFSEYQIRKEKERHLARFFEGSAVTLAYDVQVKSLLEEEGIYFYPLYEDVVVIAVDRKRVSGEITRWEDLAGIGYPINLTEKEPEQRYIWMALSHGLNGQIEKEAAQNFLENIYSQKRLYWNNLSAPIQIMFRSSLAFSMQQNSKLEMVYPKEGTLSFQVGFLSHDKLPEESVNTIRQAYADLGYTTVTATESRDDFAGNPVQPAIRFYPDVMQFGEIETPINRYITKSLKYAPNTGTEHHIIALFLIVVIVLGISYVHKTVIHLGVRRGVIYTGFVLVGWIMVGVFKYSFYGGSVYVRALWYSYYFFLMMLPPTSLYIAANIDRWDKIVFPKWLIAAWVFSLLLTAMILSNDFHQMAFRFMVSDKNLWHKYYKRNVGYYLVAIWMMLAQAGTWIYLVRKSWDSPKRKMSVLPILVLVMGISYSLMYNLQILFFRNIPLVLGMSSIVVLFWIALLKSGLIPSNYGYHKLFENSRLEMKILDLQGKLRFQSGISDFDTQKEGDMNRPFFTDENSLIWSTDIRGGTIVTKEDISELSELKRDLENLTRELEEENKILSEKEQVKSRLILLREQNKLTEEVNQIVEDKIKKMKEHLQRMQHSPEDRRKALLRLQRMAIYCKRRCELLIKSKQQRLCAGQDITRLIDEINSISSGEYSFFYGMEEGLPFSLAAQAYECYHLFCDLAGEAGIISMTSRLLKEKEETYLYFLAEGEGDALWKKLSCSGLDSELLNFKNMGDAFSIYIRLTGEN